MEAGKMMTSAGYTSPSLLDQDLTVGENEAVQILKVASETNDLDEIYNGNVDGGVPGIGKTQLGIQLAVNVQIPADYGGLGGMAIYIDTEGSFMVERALQIPEACAEDMLEYNSFLRRDSQVLQVNKCAKDFLNNIFYIRPCSYTEQIDVISYLEKLIMEHKDVKVVIIDSIAFHFRQEFEDMAVRTRLLSGIALELMKLADNYNLAVVLLNQVTTRFNEGSVQFTLALGDSWENASTTGSYCIGMGTRDMLILTNPHLSHQLQLHMLSQAEELEIQNQTLKESN